MIKKIISKKYDITVTTCYIIDDFITYYRIRCDYWTNDLKYLKDKMFFLDKKDLLKEIRKEKLNKIKYTYK